MDAVLISIQPKWCALVASGAKTLEIRKTSPKLETPFKCYIYCTKPNTTNPHEILETHDGNGKIHRCNGKVMGEFVCDGIERFDVPYPAFQGELDKRILDESCCTYYQLHRYAYHDDLYGWQISALMIYDKPKELSEFIKPCTNDLYCESCAMYSEYERRCGNRMLILKRPPQSWCYVNELPQEGETT